MKTIKPGQLILAAVMVTISYSGVTDAFHNGGVGNCDGCHSMHNSADNPIGGTAGNLLLKGSDASSTCLNCHAGGGSHHISSSDGSNTNAGGDFFWVVTDYIYPDDNGPETSFGREHGHNIVAVDFPGFIADTTNTTAPGATIPYSSGLLGCTSCHDAHGQVLDGTRGGQPAVSVSGSYGGVPDPGTIAGNYRLLGDSMYEAGNHTSDGYGFSANAPVALASGSDGASVDYGAGMAEWCANCHDAYVGTPGRHVAGASALLNGTGYDVNYNSYIATGSFVAGGGNFSDAYDPLVPFERGSAATLDYTSTEGPRATDTNNVMCLTCHRAHASAHNNAGRWDFEVEYIAQSHALESTDVPASAVPYYTNGAEIDVAAVYGLYQRSLCNKCHVQD